MGGSKWKHQPVMLSEVLHWLDPKPGQTIVDATVGYGGHARAILQAISPGGTLLGIDRDGEALSSTERTLAGSSSSVRLVRENFTDLDSILTRTGLSEVDGILFDLGVSSPQLDQEERGFSYRESAPLDMRMDQEQELDAAKVVNEYEERELARIINQYGEERWASRIAKFIVADRKRAPITTADRLVEVIKNAVPAAARREGGHPARRTFQALRMEVNGETRCLEAVLPQAFGRLREGGRIVVIAYHSIEDRQVKRAFRDSARKCICPPVSPSCTCEGGPLRVLTTRPVRPSAEEVEENPRSRSAKLRAAERVVRPEEKK
jgi:16S rRNA (cytosine1402-N4)-methyltransferase